MPYRIEVKPSAQKELGKLPRAIQKRIAAQIDRLVENPRPRGVKKLALLAEPSAPHLLGHVDSPMAEKVYARLTPEMLRAQMLAHLGQPSCSAGAADLQQIAALQCIDCTFCGR